MNYGNIKYFDVANGYGIRLSLFVSGCTNHCLGCFNQEAQDYNYGQPYTAETTQQIISHVSKPYIAGLSLLGGDPMCQNEDGLKELIELVKKIHDIGKTVWLWTGFTYEMLFPNALQNNLNTITCLRQELFTNCDVVIDGPFIEEQKDLRLQWRGSANQRVIDVKKSLDSNKIILYETKEII